MVNAFDDLDDPDDEPVMADPDALDPARRYHIVRHAHLVRAWLADLHERSLDAALAGRPDPGSKAVAGQKGDRRYADEDEARGDPHRGARRRRLSRTGN